MAMVMPRSFSSGALSIWSKAMYLLAALALASTLVMAAVSVVLPWSMCPIVPTFTCGFVRSNFFFAIGFLFLHQCSVQTYVRQGVHLCDSTRYVFYLSSSTDTGCNLQKIPIQLNSVGLFPDFGSEASL